MIRKTLLAMTIFASIAGALAVPAAASDTVNRRPPAHLATRAVSSAHPVGQVAGSFRQSAGRQAPALPHRQRQAGSGQQGRGDRGRLQRGAAADKGVCHRLLQPVRRGEHRQIRSLSAHVGHRRAIWRRADRPQGAGLGEEPARAVQASGSGRASLTSSSTTPMPTASRTCSARSNLPLPTASRSSPRTPA